MSACLLGRPVRWDGRSATLTDERLERWRSEARLVAVCPEQAGGLPTPRAPAELAAGIRAVDVLAGRGRVLGPAGEDLSAAFLRGAEQAVALAQAQGCRLALLMDGSPSCGSDEIHDGRFRGVRVAGEGVTAALLRQAGVEVFAPTALAALERRLETLEAPQGSSG